MRNPFGTSAEIPVEAAQHVFHLHCILTIDQDESPINFVLKVSAITSSNLWDVIVFTQNLNNTCNKYWLQNKGETPDNCSWEKFKMWTFLKPRNRCLNFVLWVSSCEILKITDF